MQHDRPAVKLLAEASVPLDDWYGDTHVSICRQGSAAYSVHAIAEAYCEDGNNILHAYADTSASSSADLRSAIIRVVARLMAKTHGLLRFPGGRLAKSAITAAEAAL